MGRGVSTCRRGAFWWLAQGRSLLTDWLRDCDRKTAARNSASEKVIFQHRINLRLCLCLTPTRSRSLINTHTRARNKGPYYMKLVELATMETGSHTYVSWWWCTDHRNAKAGGKQERAL